MVFTFFLISQLLRIAKRLEKLSEFIESQKSKNNRGFVFIQLMPKVQKFMPKTKTIQIETFSFTKIFLKAKKNQFSSLQGLLNSDSKRTCSKQYNIKDRAVVAEWDNVSINH